MSRTLAGDEATARNLARSEALARETCAALEAGDLERCAAAMDEGWEIKRARGPGAVTDELERLRALAKEAGALGVALMGAGGGGFVLVYTPVPATTRRALESAGLPELRFDVERDGCVQLAPSLSPLPQERPRP